VTQWWVNLSEIVGKSPNCMKKVGRMLLKRCDKCAYEINRDGAKRLFKLGINRIHGHNAGHGQRNEKNAEKLNKHEYQG
jgi:hypothetical protein